MQDAISRLNAALEGRYLIDHKLGEGGMATVYLADDLRHERRVAVKVLKPELTAVVGAERFLAEIKTTAGLQHPNILPLFDSGEAGGLLFYVMPFVDGDTLRDRLDREKQLPVDEVIRMAAALGNALDHAHRRGIIHRDIKPANVLLQDGEPVIADFGIALALGAGGGSRLTETGLSIGTPYYMSPEQASGDRDPDARSDVYALGCVFYEALVGEPPFTGGTAQSVLARILAGGARRPSELRPAIPPEVDSALAKAIERIPADRFESAVELSRALADPSFRYRVDQRELNDAAARWKKVAVVSMAASVIALAVAARAQLSRAEGEAPHVHRSTLQAEPTQRLAISADGSVAYTELVEGNSVLMVKRRDQALAERIVEAGAATAPTFSPDGRSIAFVNYLDLTVGSVPVTGGPVSVLADSVNWQNWSVAWLEGGSILFTGPGGRLDRVDSDGQVETVVPAGSFGGRGVLEVAPLPGGAAALFTACIDEACSTSNLLAVDLTSREVSVVVPGGAAGRHVAPDLLVYSRGRDLYLSRFDPKRLVLQGPESPVLQGLDMVMLVVPNYALSATGSLVYEPLTASGARNRLVWIDRDGSRTDVDPSWRDRFLEPTVSRDGRYLAVTVGRFPASDVWVRNMDGAKYPLTTDQNGHRRASFTSDNDVIYQSGPDAHPYASLRGADAAGPARDFLRLPTPLQQVVVSADERYVVYRTGQVETSTADLWLVDRGATEPTDSAGTRLLGQSYNEMVAALSPDGQFLAYAQDESGIDEVYVRPFPNVGDSRWKVSLDGGIGPRWHPGGRELSYLERESGTMVAATLFGEGQAVDSIRRTPLFRYDLDGDGDVVANRGGHFYDVDPTSGRFLMVEVDRIEEAVDPYGGRIVIVEGWAEVLRAAVTARGEGG